MLLQNFALGGLGKRDVDGCGLQIRVAQGLLDSLQVRAAGNVVGGHRVAKRMHTGASDTGFAQVLGEPVLNSPRAHVPLELTDKQSCLADLWPH